MTDPIARMPTSAGIYFQVLPPNEKKCPYGKFGAIATDRIDAHGVWK